MADIVVTSVGYSLSTTNNAEITDFVLTVVGDDGNQYHLHDHGSTKQTNLVRKVLNKIAAVWPDLAFNVKADDKTRLINDIP
jgi:hypothetical protein